ncbi:MAG: GGDEF domain-containing protein, partial [Acidobacteriota bacterium]
FGGEEFCLLAPVDRDEARSLLEELRKRVERAEIVYMGKTIRFTISTGVASHLGNSLEDMIKRADDMLYQAKREGRNRVVMEPMARAASEPAKSAETA